MPGLVAARETTFALCTMALVSGCSINDMGFVRVRHFENETARAIQLDAWGAHLTIGTKDSGLTFGHVSRTYVFAREGATLVEVPRAALEALRESSELRSTDDAPGLLGSGDPVVTLGGREGIGIDFGSSRVGLSIGARRHGVVDLPQGDETVLYFRSGEADEPPRVYIRKEAQGSDAYRYLGSACFA